MIEGRKERGMVGVDEREGGRLVRGEGGKEKGERECERRKRWREREGGREDEMAEKTQGG